MTNREQAYKDLMAAIANFAPCIDGTGKKVLEAGITSVGINSDHSDQLWLASMMMVAGLYDEVAKRSAAMSAAAQGVADAARKAMPEAN